MNKEWGTEGHAVCKVGRGARMTATSRALWVSSQIACATLSPGDWPSPLQIPELSRKFDPRELDKCTFAIRRGTLSTTPFSRASFPLISCLPDLQKRKGDTLELEHNLTLKKISIKWVHAVAHPITLALRSLTQRAECWKSITHPASQKKPSAAKKPQRSECVTGYSRWEAQVESMYLQLFPQYLRFDHFAFFRFVLRGKTVGIKLASKVLSF